MDFLKYNLRISLAFLNANWIVFFIKFWIIKMICNLAKNLNLSKISLPTYIIFLIISM